MADHPITFQHLQAAALSDLGLVRKNNEDRFFADAENGVFLVADGMGGAEAGEMASEMVKNAVEEVCREKPPAETVQTQALIDAVNQASAKIRRFAASAGFTGTGSTVCLLVFDPVNPNRAWTLNAGDSRIYRFHRKGLHQLTTDHTVATAAGVADAKALPAAFRGVLTRAAGLEDRLTMEIKTEDVAQDDVFLLCSDGLSNMVPDKTLARILKRTRKAAPAETAAALIDKAKAAGGVDNITAVLVKVGEIPSRFAALNPDPADSADEKTVLRAPALT